MKEVEQLRPLTWKTRLLAALINLLMRCLCLTVRLKVEREEETEALLQEAGGGMLVTWHGRTLLPINRWRFRRKLNHFMLVSMSRDGDLQSEVFRQMGYGVVRGSTGRRGVTATREVLAKLEQGGVLSFTPDGPRGPSGVAQPGAVYFAQRSGKPIIPTGITAWPRWQLGTWDKFMVPRPFSRALWLYGDPIYVSSDEDLTAASERVGKAIHDLESLAEARLGASPAASNSEVTRA